MAKTGRKPLPVPEEAVQKIAEAFAAGSRPSQREMQRLVAAAQGTKYANLRRVEEAETLAWERVRKWQREEAEQIVQAQREHEAALLKQ